MWQLRPLTFPVECARSSAKPMWSLVPVYSKWTGCEDGQEGAHWLCILWFKRVHNHHPRKSSPRGNRRLAPPQASPTHCDISDWSAICWSGLFSTALHLKLGSGFRGPKVALAAALMRPIPPEAGHYRDKSAHPMDARMHPKGVRGPCCVR